jgi:hypothetical protein
MLPPLPLHLCLALQAPLPQEPGGPTPSSSTADPSPPFRCPAASSSAVRYSLVGCSSPRPRRRRSRSRFHLEPLRIHLVGMRVKWVQVVLSRVRPRRIDRRLTVDDGIKPAASLALSPPSRIQRPVATPRRRATWLGCQVGESGSARAGELPSPPLAVVDSSWAHHQRNASRVTDETILPRASEAMQYASCVCVLCWRRILDPNVLW